MAEDKHTLLFVDDEVSILHSLRRLFRREGYHILAAPGGKEGLEIISTKEISLVISDNRMPEMEGVEFLSKVKDLSPDTVRFMLTGYSDMDSVLAAINSGEVSKYITKPWDDDNLKLAVKEALERYDLRKKNKELVELTKRQNEELVDLNKNLEKKVETKTKTIRDNFFSFVRISSNIMELYDPDIGGHCKRVAGLAKSMSTTMDIDKAEVDLIESAALLHSIGLMGVPKDLLDKDENSLEKHELAIIRHSPVLAQGVLSSVDYLRQVGILIRGYNEMYNGKGYPDGLKGEEIHIGSRIIAICKLYDKLTTNKDRPLKKIDAIDALLRESGISLDPGMVETFIKFIKGLKEDEEVNLRVPVEDIKAGMVLAENLLSVKGRLLVTKGTSLTNELIEKIHEFQSFDKIVDKVEIMSEGWVI